MGVFTGTVVQKETYQWKKFGFSSSGTCIAHTKNDPGSTNRWESIQVLEKGDRMIFFRPF
jgi:hypothetical protein